MRIGLCLLTRNELKGCQLDVPRIPRDCFQQIYAVDGNSSDGTWQYLESQGIRVYQQPKKGLNAAYHHAVAMSECDAVVVFFPKGTIEPSCLMQFRSLLEQGNGLVVASRMIEGSRNEEDSRAWRPRKWGVLCLARIASLIWRKEGYRVRDILHGVKGFTIESFAKMRILDHGLSIDLEMTVRAYKLRIPRAEFPVQESSRTYGESHFKLWPTARRLLKYLWFELSRHD